MRSFAKSLRNDLAAVRAAFALPWSNGQMSQARRELGGRQSTDDVGAAPRRERHYQRDRPVRVDVRKTSHRHSPPSDYVYPILGFEIWFVG
jgi:hypothetical protein